TFQVTGVPSNYTGYFYYKTSASSSFIAAGSDFITPLIESAADFSIDTTGLYEVQIDIYNSSNIFVSANSWFLTPAFVPRFYDARITSRVDSDGDGYARQFAIEFDVDSTGSGQYFVKIY